MTDALVTWLSRALDCLERFANEQNAGGPSVAWHVYADGEDYGGEPCTIRDSKGDVEATLDDPGIGQHIALHDPRAVLARVEAERAVVRAYEDARQAAAEIDDIQWPSHLASRGQIERAGHNQAAAALCGVIATLAYGHRHDFAGYSMAWAPGGVGANA